MTKLEQILEKVVKEKIFIKIKMIRQDREHIQLNKRMTKRVLIKIKVAKNKN